MIHDKKHLIYNAKENEEMYWERVNRSLGWLGDTEQEQRDRQDKLKNAVVGIAGTGGIGGQLAQRLVRMGVRNIKLADPDSFDVSNMNRQMGADLKHLGKNKAEVVADKYIPVTAVGYVPQNNALPFKCQNTQLFFQLAIPRGETKSHE